MTSSGAHSTPSEVAAEQGEVIVEGPDGVAVVLTADAAEETARRILAAVGEARRQLGGEAGSDL
jgi:hypothetical protein